MVEAHSFPKIIDKCISTIDSIPVRQVSFDSFDAAADEAMNRINSSFEKKAFIGVLFCNPATEFAKKEIIPSLNYFHQRSGDNINFFCVGYGNGWDTHSYPDFQVVTSVSGTEWQFSDQAFIKVVEEFEAKTKWEYSGETELLLMTVKKSPETDEGIEFFNPIVCKLEQMHVDKAFTSVRAFFEDIFRFAAKARTADSWNFSDNRGANQLGNFVLESILGLLPKPVSDLYKRGRHYAVKLI